MRRSCRPIDALRRRASSIAAASPLARAACGEQQQVERLALPLDVAARQRQRPRRRRARRTARTSPARGRGRRLRLGPLVGQGDALAHLGRRRAPPRPRSPGVPAIARRSSDGVAARLALQRRQRFGRPALGDQEVGIGDRRVGVGAERAARGGRRRRRRRRGASRSSSSASDVSSQPCVAAGRPRPGEQRLEAAAGRGDLAAQRRVLGQAGAGVQVGARPRRRRGRPRPTRRSGPARAAPSPASARPAAGARSPGRASSRRRLATAASKSCRYCCSVARISSTSAGAVAASGQGRSAASARPAKRGSPARAPVELAPRDADRERGVVGPRRELPAQPPVLARSPAAAGSTSITSSSRVGTIGSADAAGRSNRKRPAARAPVGKCMDPHRAAIVREARAPPSASLSVDLPRLAGLVGRAGRPPPVSTGSSMSAGDATSSCR